jgi:hypothetical protein
MTLSKIQMRAISICAVSLAMVACGDSSNLPDTGTPPVVQTPPPAAVPGIPLAATQNAASAFAFVNGVASSADDSGEGLVVGDEILATTDTEEPDPSV